MYAASFANPAERKRVLVSDTNAVYATGGDGRVSPVVRGASGSAESAVGQALVACAAGRAARAVSRVAAGIPTTRHTIAASSSVR